MDLLLLLLLLGAAAVGVAWYLRRRQAQRTEREEAARRAAPRQDPFAGAHGNEEQLYGLRPGDVVTYHASDFMVRGSIHFDQDGYRWSEHLISDDRTQYWVGVENDEGLSVTLWQRVGAGEVDGEPGAPTMQHGDITYGLYEEGEARFTAEGTTGTGPSGTARYVDYRSDSGELLSCEQLGRAWEFSVGTKALPRAFQIYPRSA